MDFLTHSFGTGFCKRAPRDQKGILLVSYTQPPEIFKWERVECYIINPCRCHPYDAFGSSIHKNMHQTMVTSSTRRRSQSKPTPTSIQVIVTAKKVTRMKIAIVVLFVICWVPFYVIMALLHLGFVQTKAVRFSVWLSVSFSGINPYVYFAFSANFRNVLKHLFGNIHIFLPRSERIELQQIQYL